MVMDSQLVNTMPASGVATGELRSNCNCILQGFWDLKTLIYINNELP